MATIPDRETLKHDLKQMIIIECDKEDELTVSDITDDEILIGSETKLGLDSLDSLQLSLAIKKTYAARIDGAKDGRLAFASINALADYIIKAQA
ncbi:MAG: acyl carrier protein [Gammaproteobacteria bacterium]|nr:acyl carrier protein [Gammaproteobacteria bacterium]